MDNVTLMRKVLEHEDWQLLIDHLADDVVFKVTIPAGTPISGELRGKQAVTDHLIHLGELMEFRQERPLEYVASGDRVVVLGRETYVVKKTGVTVPGSEYADVIDFRDGLITRFLIIQDLTAVVDAYRAPDRGAP
jgi:ketosteroid isomerase-like protein